MVKNLDLCPCGIGVPYADHCQRVHAGGAGLGVSAESLMRARYVAYGMQNRSFLLDSWHPDTRPAELDFDPTIAWLGLEVVATEAGSGLDTTGVVEFKARFSRNGEPLELHERSSFMRLDGDWVYIDGS